MQLCLSWTNIYVAYKSMNKTEIKRNINEKLNDHLFIKKIPVVFKSCGKSLKS